MIASIETAYQILGIRKEHEYDFHYIKKTYRRLMHQVHPDALGDNESKYDFSAQEINAAYEYLLKHGYTRGAQVTKKAKPTEPRSPWAAPVDPFAYTERDIYVDHIHVATGRYLLTDDEEFRMFLLSIYQCSRRLLTRYAEEICGRWMGELAYLLSQQFVDRKTILDRYEIERENKEKLYYFPAMLETEGRRCALKPGTVLVPQKTGNHRLYVQTLSGKEQGYLSFADDRIYYALIPLFEQRRVSVKIRVSGSTSGNNRVRAIKVRTVDLWVKMPECNQTQIEITLSDRIRQLLQFLENQEEAAALSE